MKNVGFPVKNSFDTRTIVIAALADRIAGRTRLTAKGGCECSDVIVRRCNRNEGAGRIDGLKKWPIRRRTSAGNGMDEYDPFGTDQSKEINFSRKHND